MSDIRHQADNLSDPLTEREQEILGCLAEGLSNQEIANRLHLALRTVKWYNSQIYSKLDVSGRKEAVEQANVLGLLNIPSGTPILDGKHNLPSQITPFIRRRHEISELTALLNDETTRLITILASGGMGKTRLSQEVARIQIGRFANGVFFVPLAPLSSPKDIVTTIAENIGFIFHGENSPAQQLVNFLQDRSILLVLDNFEHLLEGAKLVTDIIKSSPKVKVLVTRVNA
jgi:DNA-binding CsgD family transcriptional regulator